MCDNHVQADKHILSVADLIVRFLYETRLVALVLSLMFVWQCFRVRGNEFGRGSERGHSLEAYLRREVLVVD